MNATRKAFLQFSAELTGYPAVELEGTGLVNDYRELLEQQVGQDVAAQWYATARRVLRHKAGKAREERMRIDVIASPILWPVCTALIVLWYQGFWSLPAAWYTLTHVTPPKGTVAGSPIVPSAAAYTRQLAYRAAGAHPPGANPTGFGSWSIPPVFGDAAAVGKERR